MKNIAMALAIAVSMFAGNQLMAQDSGVLQNRLFQNQYTQAGASQHNAALYIAPQPVPGRVGHTYYTYEALYPHEHLYTHKRRYFNYYAGPEAFYGDSCKRGATGGGALNRTTVIWQSGNQHFGNFPFSFSKLQNAQYKYFNRKYCLGASSGGNGLKSRIRTAGGLGGFGGGASGGSCPSGDCGY